MSTETGASLVDIDVVANLEAIRGNILSLQTRIDTLSKQFDLTQTEQAKARETVQATEIQIALLENDLRKLSESFASLYGMVVVGNGQPSLMTRVQVVEVKQGQVVDAIDDIVDGNEEQIERSGDFWRNFAVGLLFVVIAGILGFFGGIWAK